MKRSRVRLLFLLAPFASLAVFVACSSSSDVPGGATTPDGSAPSNEASASTPDGGGGNDAGEGDGSCAPVVLDGSAPNLGPPVCDPSKTIKAGQALSVSTDKDDVMESITPDELTIAWYTSVGAQLPMFADRASKSDAFGAAQTLDTPVAVGRGMTLAANGLSIVLAAGDGKSFIELTRAARGDAFANPGEGPFAALDAVTLGDDETYSEPLLAGNGLVFIYSRVGTGATTIFQSTRTTTTGNFPVGTPVSGCDLDAVDGDRRVPIALSNDARTFVFFDRHTAKTRMAWRPGTDWPFNQFVDLGSIRPQLNATCDTVYYSSKAATTSGDDLFSAPRN